MLGAATIINPIMKLVTTVAILAAVYFFVIKPTLETTESISGSVNDSIEGAFGQTDRQVQRALRRANRSAGSAGLSISGSDLSPEQASRLLECIQDAAGDVAAMQACAP